MYVSTYLIQFFFSKRLCLFARNLQTEEGERRERKQSGGGGGEETTEKTKKTGGKEK